MRWWGGVLALTLMSTVITARADPTMDECIDANTKAQALRRSGKLREARQKLLLCGSPSCPKLVKDDCTQRMEEVERVMPSIVFQVKDAQGRDLTNVKASIDGAPVGSLAGTALQVDVGDHEFVFSADGYNAVTQHFVIVEAQKDRREIVTLTSNAPVVVEPPPPPPVVAQPQPPTPQLVVNPVTYAPPLVANPAAAEARSSRRTTAIILCVFGAVSLGGSVAFGVLGGQENSSIKNGGFSTASDIASADTAGTAFNVMLGVTLASGLVLAAIGVPLLLLNLGDGTPTRSVGLHVTPGGLRLQW